MLGNPADRPTLTTEGANSAPSRAEAIERLAKRLHWKMAHLDGDVESWDELSERDRDYYRLCVRALKTDRLAIAALL